MLKALFYRFKTPRKGPVTLLRVQGKHYNLQEVYNQLNDRYFEGTLPLRITWFTPKKAKYQRRIVLGSFQPHRKLIRINQTLDQANIPAYFLHFIVYHEMLHFVLPPILHRNRRREIHHPAFKQQEKKFHDYLLARSYQKASKKQWFIK